MRTALFLLTVLLAAALLPAQTPQLCSASDAATNGPQIWIGRFQANGTNPSGQSGQAVVADALGIYETESAFQQGKQVDVEQRSEKIRDMMTQRGWTINSVNLVCVRAIPFH